MVICSSGDGYFLLLISSFPGTVAAIVTSVMSRTRSYSRSVGNRGAPLLKKLRNMNRPIVRLSTRHMDERTDGQSVYHPVWSVCTIAIYCLSSRSGFSTPLFVHLILVVIVSNATPGDLVYCTPYVLCHGYYAKGVRTPQGFAELK